MGGSSAREVALSGEEPLEARELEQLALLLQRLSAAGQGVPRMPKEVFVSLKGVCAQPTAEVLAVAPGGAVLLTRRDDQHWNGWHLPGGFVGCEETLDDACDRIARAELEVGARLQRIVAHTSWRDHPYASALSLLCLCELDAAPRGGRFFEDLPADLLPEHRDLLRQWIAQVEEGAFS